MGHRRSVSVAGLGTAIICLLAFAPGVAGAHTARFDGKVTIKENPAFHGRVTSERPRCQKHRKVKVYREQNGPDGLFVTTETDDDGRWEHLSGQVTGDFYAKIKRTNIGSGGHRHVCRGDRSSSVHVQPPPP